MEQTNSEKNTYSLYLVFYYYHLRWTKPYNSLINQNKHAFCYMFCPDGIPDLYQYTSERLISYYSDNTGKSHSATVTRMDRVEQTGGVVIPRIFEVVYVVNDEYFRGKTLFLHKDKAKSKERAKSRYYRFLRRVSAVHAGVVSHTVIFVYDEDNMTDDNIEEVLLRKIPKSNVDTDFIISSIKEIIPSIQ